jgi:hypothetical protein
MGQFSLFCCLSRLFSDTPRVLSKLGVNKSQVHLFFDATEEYNLYEITVRIKKNSRDAGVEAEANDYLMHHDRFSCIRINEDDVEYTYKTYVFV